MGACWLRGKRFLFEGSIHVLKVWWWMYNSVNTLKAIDLYTLHWWIVWHLNYILIKPLKNNFPDLWILPIYCTNGFGRSQSWPSLVQINKHKQDEAIILTKHSNPQNLPVSWCHCQMWMTSTREYTSKPQHFNIWQYILEWAGIQKCDVNKVIFFSFFLFSCSLFSLFFSPSLPVYPSLFFS